MLNKFEHAWGLGQDGVKRALPTPMNRMTDTHNRKHHLLATSCNLNY